ncbi:Lcl C-terminal domain-containing protein [Sulfurimonas sp.]
MKFLLIGLFVLYGFSVAVANNQTQHQVVVDKVHNLEWQDNVQRDELKWKLARGYCRQLHLNGFHDWRLPSHKELISLCQSQKIKKEFNFLDKALYWSLQNDKQEDLNAMTVYMGNGYLSSSDKCDKNFYICVRSTK